MSKKKSANIVISVIAFFVVFFAFCAFAIDFSYVLAVRAKLQQATDATALATAPVTRTRNSADSFARKYFSYHQSDVLSSSSITVSQKTNAVKIEATCNAPTFFLSVLGINTITVQARSSARVISEELPKNASLGISHHVEFIVPRLIINKPGPEFIITKNGCSRNYWVYVGLESSNGTERWLDVSCTIGGTSPASSQEIDLDNDCISSSYGAPITAAKYIRVINRTSNVPAEHFNVDVTLTNTTELIKNSVFNAIK